jgi:1,4-dihydroxy-2-naphthoate octaprenyltransferase
VRAWILAARPKTLPAAVVPVWLGTLLAWRERGEVSIHLAAATLLSTLCIQIATNLFNDALDARKGADTDRRLGPVRVTASGQLPIRAVLLGGFLFCLVAALFGLPLIAARGPVILLIGTVSLLLAYAYTGGPYPLAYHGLGEVFVVFFFGFVATQGTYFVQTGITSGPEGWIVALQTGLLSAVLIGINNLRDAAEDATTGKRTLAVRWGPAFARGEIILFCGLPFALGPAAWGPWSPAGWMPCLALPLAIVICRGLCAQPPGRVYNRFLALAGVQLLGFAVLLTVGILRQGPVTRPDGNAQSPVATMVPDPRTE